jgi:uncharacterized protein (DUF305 family)
MENKYTTLIAALGLVLIALFFVFRNDEVKEVSTHSPGMHMMSDGSYMLNEGMEDMHESMNVSTDEEFLKGMIPHHQEAVDTAREVLARGGSFDEIKVLAENIVTSQKIEIEKMETWHMEWLGVSYSPDASYKPMMRDISNLSGKDLDKVFLEDMVMHHMGAVMMAQQAKSFTQREEIRVLSDEIIKAQNTEITLMKGWLENKF